jgi:putative drug exporter of the RND superfamily
VASVTPAQISPKGKAMLATLYPATSPQASQTISLVDNLRDNLIPQAEHGTSLAVHVGGVTATNIDFSHVLTDKLPLFIAVSVLLAFLPLMAVFRSLLIPLTASVMNLLSVGAALGGLNAASPRMFVRGDTQIARFGAAAPTSPRTRDSEITAVPRMLARTRLIVAEGPGS